MERNGTGWNGTGTSEIFGPDAANPVEVGPSFLHLSFLKNAHLKHFCEFSTLENK